MIPSEKKLCFIKFGINSTSIAVKRIFYPAFAPVHSRDSFRVCVSLPKKFEILNFLSSKVFHRAVNCAPKLYVLSKFRAIYRDGHLPGRERAQKSLNTMQIGVARRTLIFKGKSAFLCKNAFKV